MRFERHQSMATAVFLMQVEIGHAVPPEACSCALLRRVGVLGGEGGTEAGYESYMAMEPLLRRTFAARLALLPQPGPGARLLNVGCGPGAGIDTPNCESLPSRLMGAAGCPKAAEPF